MNVNDFARRCVKRLATQGDEPDLLGDWNLFTAMLQATAAYVPDKLRFDDEALHQEQKYLTHLEKETVDPVEDAHRLTPHVDTVKQYRANVAAIHVLRALWAAFSAYFAAEGMADEDAKTQALVRVVALSEKYPQVYGRLELHFHPLAVGEAEASQTDAYQRYYEVFHPPETWIMNGGEGRAARSIFPPYALTDPAMIEVYAEVPALDESYLP